MKNWHNVIEPAVFALLPLMPLSSEYQPKAVSNAFSPNERKQFGPIFGFLGYDPSPAAD